MSSQDRAHYIRAKADEIRAAEELYAQYVALGGDLHGKDVVLQQVITAVIAAPESATSQALKKIAALGDYRCTRAIEPLLNGFYDGDFEYQEAIIDVLGDISHLADNEALVNVIRFIAEISISEEFCPGTGVDRAACKAFKQIWTEACRLERFRHPYLPLHQCRVYVDHFSHASCACFCNWDTPCDFRSEWQDDRDGSFKCQMQEMRNCISKSVKDDYALEEKVKEAIINYASKYLHHSAGHDKHILEMMEPFKDEDWEISVFYDELIKTQKPTDVIGTIPAG